MSEANMRSAAMEEICDDRGLPVLEESCAYCRGVPCRREEGSGRELTCGMCNGAGFIPTAFGERVLELIRHNAISLRADSLDAR